MQFITSKENLLNGLKNVVAVASERTTMPILSCVMLKEEGGKLNICANNLDTCISSVVDVEEKTCGGICVNAKKFFDIIKELKNVPMTISATENTLKIESDSGVFKIAGLSVDEFPQSYNIEKENEIDIDFNVLRDVFRRVTFCINKNDTRKELSGISLVIKKGKMTVVGTDGHKLSTIERNVNTEKECNIIISKDTIDVFNNIGDGNQVIFDTNCAVFYGKNILISRLIEGPYPNYKQVIPTQNNKIMKVNREDFTKALKRISVFTGDNEMVKLTIGANVCKMSALNRDTLSEGLETIKCECDFEMEIGFNNKILSEIVNAFYCDMLVFKLLDSRCAGLIYPSNDIDGETWFTLIMPLLMQ